MITTMIDNVYIEKLADFLLSDLGFGGKEAEGTAQAITDWHREQGLQVTPADHISMPRNVFELLTGDTDAPDGITEHYLNGAKGDGDES